MSWNLLSLPSKNTNSAVALKIEQNQPFQKSPTLLNFLNWLDAALGETFWENKMHFLTRSRPFGIYNFGYFLDH